MVEQKPWKFEAERTRSSHLTFYISSIIALILLVLAFVYISNLMPPNTSLAILFGASSLLFLLPPLCINLDKLNTARVLLCLLFPAIIIALSVKTKSDVIAAGLINPVSYLDMRIALINAIFIPIVIYAIREIKSMIFLVAFPILLMIFFDPIHSVFNVGYQKTGLANTDYYFSANFYSILTVAFLATTLVYLKFQLYKGDRKQFSENSKIRTYLSTLMKLSNSRIINEGKVELAKQEIIKLAQSTLNISRVSIWRFDAQKDAIMCEYLNEDGIIKSPGTELTSKDAPFYFEKIKNQELIIAQEALKDPLTSEFVGNYLEPLSIHSLMDAPFISKGKLGGVICCEHQHEIKEWDVIESMFLKALGDFLTYTIIVNERVQQNDLLEEKNQEISTINENLEAIVRNRTIELEKKNDQLTEYAFINSHILRAPVARISGLYNLFKHANKKEKRDLELLLHFTKSVAELEQVTLQINRAIEEHGNISRKEFEH